ncbi:expressed protein [Chlorella variabilis]|uniref:Expressed protein n=1 Tax=Chlorella variabilis TaxID=554065 RepID=E1Z8G3_CHLVA|nr:expressed protein [Chlorella variabilis]EFN58086.1 expressed protein [Chlorella variabilis]|eukprot:XP_005850188.1 expressed protein [Chlorella variabilis]
MYTLVLVGSFVLRTARRLFWYLLACAIGVVLVRWLQSIEGIGMMWVFLSAIMAASMIEDEVVKSKGLTLMDVEATRRLRSRLRTPEAQGKAERLMDIVGTISHGRGATLGARQLWARMSGTMRRLRRSLHSLLQQARRRGGLAGGAGAAGAAEADELNYILCTINAPAMVEVCSRATLELLTRERLPELTTETRHGRGMQAHTCRLTHTVLASQAYIQSVLVDSLQKVGMRYRPQRQLWAAAVLLNTRGLELTLLKNYLDDGGDYHTCYKLCYHDLQVGGREGGKCYYPGALALYAELDRCFARRYQAALHRLRMQQRRHPVVLPGAPLGTLGTAATVPTSGDASGCEDDPAGGSPRAQDADATPPPEPSSEPTFSWGRSFGRTESSSGAAAAAAAAAEQAAAAAAAPGQAGAAGGGSAPDLAMAASIGARPTPPIPVPVLRHNSSGGGGGGGGSLGRPPRSPRPGPAPPRRAAVLGMSPQSSRQLPAGEPLLSPSGMSPQSSSGALLGPDDGGSSLAGSTWGASSLQTQAPRGASGTAELADTLTSRLRPLVTSASGGGPLSRHAFTQQRSLSGGSEGLVGPQPQPPFASVQPHQEGSNLVFLSARPESYKARRKRGMTESEAYRKYFQPFVQRGDLDTSPTMLLGAMASGPKALLQWLGVVTWFPALAPPEDNKTAVAALYQQLAAKKLSRFREYAAIYPEACFVLIGDNGQGDLLCAEILWSSMRQNLPPGQRSRLLACLMHKVVPTGHSYSMLRSSKTVKTQWHASWQQRGIHFAKSHVGMALQAYEDGLLTSEALHRVCIAAAADFRRVWARYGERHAGRNLGKALKHLNADLRAANYVLPPRLQVPPLAIPGLAEGESLKGSRLPPPSPARSEALSDMSGFGFGQAVLS